MPFGSHAVEVPAASQQQQLANATFETYGAWLTVTKNVVRTNQVPYVSALPVLPIPLLRTDGRMCPRRDAPSFFDQRLVQSAVRLQQPEFRCPFRVCYSAEPGTARGAVLPTDSPHQSQVGLDQHGRWQRNDRPVEQSRTRSTHSRLRPHPVRKQKRCGSLSFRVVGGSRSSFPVLDFRPRLSLSERTGGSGSRALRTKLGFRFDRVTTAAGESKTVTFSIANHSPRGLLASRRAASPQCRSKFPAPFPSI